MRLVSEDVKQVRITEKDLKDMLGAPGTTPERQVLEERVGVVNGLAWTSVGGELLEVEVNVVPGSGQGGAHRQPGRRDEGVGPRRPQLYPQPGRPAGHPRRLLQGEGHPRPLPRGRVPKDGPSAGIAITTAMVSALTGAPVRGASP